MDELVATILSVVKGSTFSTVRRCLDKATSIVFYNGIFLVTDDEYIYYFGAMPESRTPSKLGTFVKNHKHLAQGKKYYSKDNKVFSRKSKALDIDKDLYSWD